MTDNPSAYDELFDRMPRDVPIDVWISGLTDAERSVVMDLLQQQVREQAQWFREFVARHPGLLTEDPDALLRNSQQESEISPLHEAAVKGKKKRLRTLLESGADVNAIWHGRTPLMCAAAMGRAKTVRLLIDYGADVNLKGHEGSSPLQSVVMLYPPRGPWEATIRNLVEVGADINATDDLGFTALMHAAKDGDVKVMRLLLSLGAATDTINEDGITALSLAEAGLEAARHYPLENPEPYQKTIELLAAYGAKR